LRGDATHAKGEAIAQVGGIVFPGVVSDPFAAI